MNAPSIESLSQELEALTLSDCIERQIQAPINLRDFSLIDGALTDEQSLLKRLREQPLSEKVRVTLLMAALHEKLPSDVWVRYEFALIVAPHASALSALSRLYVLANLYGGISQKNTDCLGFFLNFCATLLELIEPIQSMRLHSAAIAENNIHSYFRFLRLAREITRASEDYAETEAFNKISNEVGAPFLFENYSELSTCSDIKLLAQYEGDSTRSENAVSGNRSFYLFRKNIVSQRAPQHASFNLHSGYFSFDISREGRPEYYFLDEGKRPIRGLCYGFRPFADPPIAEIVNAAFIDDMFPGNNICHLLVDKLPRTALFTDETNKFVLFEDSPYLRDFAPAFLPHARFQFLGGVGRGTVRCRDFLVSTTSIQSYFHTLHNGSAYALQFAESLRKCVRERMTQAKEAQGAQKVFISRRDASYRNATNWMELEAFMIQRGYAIVSMAELDPVQQVLSIAGASCVVGIHGAGLANILFPEKCRVLEIFPSTYGSTAYWKLAAILGHDYYYYAVHEPRVDDSTFAGASTVFDNLTVDISDFQRYMDQNSF